MAQSFRVAELDFDTIKSNLKSFISSKSTFTDYDFEGSGLSVLLDVLAYNTHYNAIIANMLTQEMFLDTATKRETVSMHAKKLGYIPRSMRAARATVSLEVFPTDAPMTLSLGKGAYFKSGGKIQFDFITTDAITIERSTEGRYIFSNVPIVEGKYDKFSYVVSGNSNKFQIPNKSVDISLLRVFVQQSNTNTELVEYKLYDSIVDVDDTTLAYFIQINELGYYEISFGDNVVGKKIINGNIVTLQYVVCNGELPNGAGAFMISDSVEGYSNIAVTTVSKAFGGAQQETISSIKENASKRVLTQNRAVSISDYKPMVQQIVGVGDVIAWGGENNNPPMYGKVFLSILNELDASKILSETEKMYIMDQLKAKMMVTITPEIIDPELLFVEIDSTVYFDPYKTTNTASQIKTMVFDAISAYVADKLNKFSSELRNSNLLYEIDSADSAITSNITKYKLKKKFIPYLNQTKNYVFDFKNPIMESSNKQDSLATTGFYVNIETQRCYLRDSAGSVILYKLVDGNVIDVETVGTIDYKKGIISLDNLMITSADNGEITIRCNPVSNDIICLNNTALICMDSDITINTISESNIYNHTFTSSV